MIHYQFPVLDDASVLPEAIAGRDEFHNHIKGEDGARYQVWDYAVNFKDTFPELTGDPVVDRIPMLRRECRGLITCPDTGRILSRAFHKYFNVGERDEVRVDSIDLRRRHYRLEKLDGSMIRAYVPGDDKLHWNTYPTRPLLWGTMAGVTDVAANARAFLESTNVPFEKFARDLVDEGYTPIFEWLSRKNRIVVDYPQDRLVLTGIRHRRLGTYLTYDQMSERADALGVPVVQAYDSDGDLARIIAETKAQLEGEGYVIRFDDGHMLKIKADLYCLIHRTKEHLVFEKNLIGLILRKELDDVLPNLPESDRDRVIAYGDSVNRAINTYAVNLLGMVRNFQSKAEDKKSFAMMVKSLPDSPMLFRIYNGDDPRQTVINRVLAHTGSATKLEEVRSMIGKPWETF